MLDDSLSAERVPPTDVPESSEDTVVDGDDHGQTRYEDSDARERLEIGDRFAGFQVRGILGRGAMGVVYEAWDPTLERRVALKLLRSPSKRAAERLLREARALARLDHPGVVRIWAADVHRGAVYIAMELVEGQNLREWLKVDRSWREVLPVLIGAGRGLAAAHAAGVVHRDFKPENVLVGWDGQARVLDFGIARVSEQRGDTLTGSLDGELEDFDSGTGQLSGSFAGLAGAEANLTEAGSLIGTLLYMAPEQHEREPADERSDQFAFCVSLFEALYGRHPFPAKTREELAYKVFERQISYPEGERAKVPRWLHRAMVRGLSPKPEDRFDTMEDLLEALERYPGRRRRRQRYAAVASVLIGAVALGFAMPKRGGDRPDPCVDVASGAEAKLGAASRAELVAHFEDLDRPWAKPLGEQASRALGGWSGRWIEDRTEACELRHAHREATALDERRAACFDEQLEQVEALVEVLAEGDANTLVNTEQALAKLPDPGQCLGDDPPRARTPLDTPDADELVLELDKVRWLAETGGGSTARERAIALVARLRELEPDPGTQALLAESLIAQAGLENLYGEGERAEALLREAARISERAGADRVRAWAVVDLGWLQATEPSRAHLAVETLEDADAVLDRVGRPFNKHVRQRLGLAEALLNGGEPERAEAVLRELLEEIDPEDSDHDYNRLAAHLALGRAARARGDHEGALSLAEAAIAELEERVSSSHPLLASPLTNAGLALAALGRHDEARVAYERSVKLRRAQVEALDSPGPKRRLAVNLVNLGNLESALGKGSVAAGHYREALALVPEDDASTRALLLFNLGVDHQVAGRHEQALSHYRSALAMAERVYPATHPRVVGSRMGVGSMLVALGRPGEAREPLERAHLDWPANMRGSLDEAELDFALAQALLADDELDASERRRALELADRARAIYEKAKLEAEAERIATWKAAL